MIHALFYRLAPEPLWRWWLDRRLAREARRGTVGLPGDRVVHDVGTPIGQTWRERHFEPPPVRRSTSRSGTHYWTDTVFFRNGEVRQSCTACSPVHTRMRPDTCSHHAAASAISLGSADIHKICDRCETDWWEDVTGRRIPASNDHTHTIRRFQGQTPTRRSRSRQPPEDGGLIFF